MIETISVIALHQPWASLVFAGAKSFETRGRRYPARLHQKRIAIHAAKRLERPEPGSVLEKVCIEALGRGWEDRVPRGAIIGTAVLMECYRTEELTSLSLVERACGNYAPGRFAWLLGGRNILDEPVPAIGRQSWWSVPLSSLAQ